MSDEIKKQADMIDGLAILASSHLARADPWTEAELGIKAKCPMTRCAFVPIGKKVPDNLECIPLHKIVFRKRKECLAGGCYVQVLDA
jgi:hypothetical protein